MNTIKADKKLTPPILSCLIDDNPGQQIEAPHSKSYVLRQLRESVRRDLEHLFNTRVCCISPPKNMPNLQHSLLNYGLRDIASINMESNRHVEEFCREMEQTIKTYEPRIKSINVSATNFLDPEEKCFHFRVEAVLHASPEQETIIFDSKLNPSTQNIEVKENQQ